MASEPLLMPSEELSPSLAIEKHVLCGTDDLTVFTNGTHVVLNVDGTANLVPRDRDSARVHTKVLSEYKWASEECYKGRILAAHKNFVAYRLFNESTGEAVRVLERLTSRRHLIKSFKHPTADLQWAAHAPLLAVLDINANIYVYHVDENCLVTKYLNIIRRANAVPASLTPRLTWCPYIPDVEDPHEEVHLVAVYFGCTVDVLSLSSVKSALQSEEVTLEQCELIPDGRMTLPIDDENTDVQAVCLSPDATAVAVAHDNGIVTFFILESEGTKFAHRWQPEHGRRIQNLVFLDNIDNTETPEQFWKYAITSSDDGKRINMYDTENWHCIARIIFEPSDRITKLALGMDPTARFIFLTDYDAANIYCIEITYAGNVPRFAACTEVTFCHPLVNAVSLSLAEQSQQDISLDDDDDTKTSLVAAFVALSQRSLLFLEIDLEIASSLQNGDESKAECLFTRPIAVEGSAANGNGAGEDVKEEQSMEAVRRDLMALKGNLEQQSDYFERRMQEESNRTNSVLEQMREDFVSRDERLCLKLESLITENRSATVESLQTSLDVKMNDVLLGLKEVVSESLQLHAQQPVPSVDHQEVADEVKKSVQEALYTVIVPHTERIVRQMFNELNEIFRKGLQEYLDELRVLCTMAVNGRVANSETDDPVTSELLADVNEGRYADAFEKALGLKTSSLLFVCSKVDPELLGTEKAWLPQHILLCMLNQIAADLNSETDLKLRYIENALMALDTKDGAIVSSYSHVLSRIQSAVTAYQAKCKIDRYKRRARIILQIISGLRQHNPGSSC